MHTTIRRTSIVAVVVAFTLVMGACSNELDDIAIGDCVQDDTPFGESSGPVIEVVPCSEPHNAEKYADVGSASECGGALFEDYVGAGYFESEIYDYSITYGSSVSCFLFIPEGGDVNTFSTLTEPLRNSGR